MIVLFLGKNKENKFSRLSKKGPIKRFGELWFLATRMCIKRSHKNTFFGYFQKGRFFKQNRDLLHVLHRFWQ